MIGRRRSLAMMLVAGALAFAGALAAQEPAVTPAPEPRAEAGEGRGGVRWTDPDGQPLPFRSDEELIAFLGTAEVKSEKRLSGGGHVPHQDPPREGWRARRRHLPRRQRRVVDADLRRRPGQL